MQGPAKRSIRITVAAAFSAAFVAGSLLIFWLIASTGELFGIANVPLRWRIVVAAAVLILLAAADIFAVAKATYCPITWRRQTPRSLLRRSDMRVVALLWGFDTGLLVTTFRVAAVGWGALFLSALGFTRGWTGIAYGLGFTIPFLLLLLRPELGRASRADVPENPGLESMLRRRPLLQGASAVMLTASGVILLAA